MRTNKLIILLVFLMTLCALAAAASYFYMQSQTPVEYTADNTPFKVLSATNAAFAQADSAASAGNYAEAKRLYAQAMGAATDPIQAGQIEYKLAQLEDAYGDPVTAIGLYKKIVANPAYAKYKTVSAYAVQAMAELYYRSGNVAVAKEIFKDKPYSDMIVPGNNQLTLRHLEEYSTSFYPLGMAELRIASWYADNINSSTSPETIATSTYPALIQKSLALADADIVRTKSDTNAAKAIPAILLRKASLYLRMYDSHLASADQAEQACKTSLTIYTAIGRPTDDGYARFYYAVLLSELGATRTNELKAILAPLYTDAAYKKTNVMSFFAAEKNNPLGQKTRLSAIAARDPNFKQLLISLGWSEKDF